MGLCFCVILVFKYSRLYGLRCICFGVMNVMFLKMMMSVILSRFGGCCLIMLIFY